MSRRERRLSRKLRRKGAPQVSAGTSGATTGRSLEALGRRAAELYRAGRLSEALQVCREALTLQPERADVLAFAGLLALKTGESAEAAELYRRVIALRPDLAEAHYNLGNALKTLGRMDEAVAAYRRAAELRPDLAPAHHNMGSALQALERFEEAAAAYRRVLAILPTSADTLRNLGIVLQRLKRPEEAGEAYRRALEARPGWPEAYNNLANLYIEEGDAKAALAVSDAWLASNPGSIEALAYKCLALNEVGDKEALRYLLDFDRLVRIIDHQAPEGYASLEDFNRALAEHVVDHPTMRVPPPDHPTYHNPHLQITDELLVGDKGPMAVLEEMMCAAMEDYRRNVPVEPDHPFLAHWPRRWRISSWATLLEGRGNLVPHIHIDGYLGGVYYPELPDVVREPEEGHAGWFELGRPPDELPTRAEPEVRVVQPREGRMLLFPSYFYHRTVPFDSTERRVSIAFDMVPEG